MYVQNACSFIYILAVYVQWFLAHIVGWLVAFAAERQTKANRHREMEASTCIRKSFQHILFAKSTIYAALRTDGRNPFRRNQYVIFSVRTWIANVHIRCQPEKKN